MLHICCRSKQKGTEKSEKTDSMLLKEPWSLPNSLSRAQAMPNSILEFSLPATTSNTTSHHRHADVGFTLSPPPLDAPLICCDSISLRLRLNILTLLWYFDS